ncbi:MAG: hypothetical protein RIE52_06070 [Balneola sp.]|jgi:hypothetical protein
MSIKISTDFDNNFEVELLKEADKHMSDIIKKEISNVVCKEHNQRPVIKSISKVNNQLKLDVEYCCSSLEKNVNKALNK